MFWNVHETLVFTTEQFMPFMSLNWQAGFLFMLHFKKKEKKGDPGKEMIATIT